MPDALPGAEVNLLKIGEEKTNVKVLATPFPLVSGEAGDFG
jgi:hypothetical protein